MAVKTEKCRSKKVEQGKKSKEGGKVTEKMKEILDNTEVIFYYCFYLKILFFSCKNILLSFQNHNFVGIKFYKLKKIPK